MAPSHLAASITLCTQPHQSIAVVAPSTGALLGEIPAGCEADVELAVNRARAAQEAWSERPFGDRSRIFSELSRPASRSPEGSLGSYPTGDRQGPPLCLRGGSRHRRGVPVLRAPRRGAAAAEAPPGGSAAAHPDVGIPHAGRSCGVFRPLELSPEPGDYRRSSSADGRQYGRPEARSSNQFHGPLGGGTAARGRAAAGCPSGGHRRRSGHRAGSGRSRRLRDVHRQRADRKDRRQPRGGTPDRLLARAGRQKSDDRAGRCRPGGGRGWRRERLFRRRRTGMHIHRADLRARVSIRAVRAPFRGTYEVAAAGRGAGLLRGRRVAHFRAAARSRRAARARCPGEGRDTGRRRTPPSGPGAALL